MEKLFNQKYAKPRQHVHRRLFDNYLTNLNVNTDYLLFKSERSLFLDYEYADFIRKEVNITPKRIFRSWCMFDLHVIMSFSISKIFKYYITKR